MLSASFTVGRLLTAIKDGASVARLIPLSVKVPRLLQYSFLKGHITIRRRTDRQFRAEQFGGHTDSIQQRDIRSHVPSYFLLTGRNSWLYDRGAPKARNGDPQKQAVLEVSPTLAGRSMSKDG